MLAGRIILFGILIISLSTCRKEKEQPAADPVDSTATAVVEVDSTLIAFHPDDEWLGLGVQEFGDLDSMISRRRIRALVPYTHLYFYIDGKERRGIAYDALNQFEISLNKQLNFNPAKVRVIFIPVNRTQVIPLLREGYGDVAYAGMTITKERQELVDFSHPTITGLKEIVVAGKSSPKLNSLADLSGKEIYLHKGSSYESAIVKLNGSLTQKGLSPIIVKQIDPYLETEDILQLVNSGVIPYSATVEDAARLWTNVMDSLVLYDKIPLDSNVSYGWVFRKNSPKFKAAADKFIMRSGSKGTGYGNMLYKKYVVNTRLLPGMHKKGTVAQVKALRTTFQKYAQSYKLDWLLLVAQGYQESRLNQSAVSHVGAIGIMQVMPATAAGRPLYIKNINRVDNNVHAGVKYMRFLIDQYFSTPEIDTLNQHLFALAAYNCGPGRVAQLRKKAKARGLDHNKWFDSVEIIAAQEIGRETVQYVSNIYKFYASYRALDYYVSQSGKTLVQ